MPVAVNPYHTANRNAVYVRNVKMQGRIKQVNKMIDTYRFPEVKRYMKDYDARFEADMILKSFLYFEPDCDHMNYTQAFVDVLERIEPLLPEDYTPLDRGTIFNRLGKLKDYELPLDVAIGIAEATLLIDDGNMEWLDIKSFMEKEIRKYTTWTTYEASINYTDCGVKVHTKKVKDLFQRDFAGTYRPEDLRKDSYHMTNLAYIAVNPKEGHRGFPTGGLISQDIIVEGGGPPSDYLANNFDNALCYVTAKHPEYHLGGRNVLDNLYDPIDDDDVVQAFWQRVFDFMVLVPNKLEIICHDDLCLTIRNVDGKAVIEW